MGAINFGTRYSVSINFKFITETQSADREEFIFYGDENLQLGGQAEHHLGARS